MFHKRHEGNRTVMDIGSAMCHLWHHLIALDLAQFQAENQLTTDELVRNYVVIFEGDDRLYNLDYRGDELTLKPNRNWRIERRDDEGTGEGAAT